MSEPMEWRDGRKQGSAPDANPRPGSTQVDAVDKEDGNPAAPSPFSRRGLMIIGIIVVVLLCAGLLLGLLPRRARDRELARQTAAARNSLPVVTVAQARRAPANTRLELPGTISPLTETPLYARASGYLASRRADIGDRVRQGALLARIDAPDLDRQVDQARATLLQGQSVLGQAQAQLNLQTITWKRYEVLVQRGVLSLQEGDTERANYEVAQANVLAAQNSVRANQANLDRMLKLQQYERVVAPFGGIVTARNVDVGALISTSGAGSPGGAPTSQDFGASGSTAATPSTGQALGGPLFRIANIDTLRVFTSVPQAYAASVKPGQTAAVSISDLPNREFTGKVTRTANALDPNTRTLLAEVQLPNPGHILLPGMYATVEFESALVTPPVLVPGDAIMTRTRGTQVALVRDGVVHVQSVSLGRDYGQQVEIVSGVQEGDQVVLNPTDAVVDGAKVNTRPAPSNASSSGGQNASAAEPNGAARAPGQPNPSGSNAPNPSAQAGASATPTQQKAGAQSGGDSAKGGNDRP